MQDKTVKTIVLISSLTALIVIGAIFSFPAPWNPLVPFTLATLFVILSGMLLGPLWGTASVGLYLLLGIIGLPVFARGAGGFQVIMGPTGGFLIGYLMAAFLAGLIVHFGKQKLPVLIAAALVGTLVIYIPGLPWMHWKLTGLMDNWTWAMSWGKYTAPFLIGDGIKAIVAVAICHALRGRIDI